MRRILVPALAACAALGLWLVPAARAADEKSNDADQKFMKQADQIDMTEIRLAKMALENSSNEAVHQFAQRMIDDHGRMNKELRQLAEKEGAQLPESLNQKHQEMVDQLSKLKGAEFDRTYTKDMVPDHEKAIKKFEDEAQNGQNPAVKAWAAQGVKTLEEHLRLARQTVKAVQNGR